MPYPAHLDPVEREIIDRLIRDVLAAGHVIWVHDGDAVVLRRSSDHDEIASRIATSFETTLIIESAPDLAWIWLIHGNGCDVIGDWTPSAEPFLTEASS
jgi:hypothetical protein